MVHLEGDPRAPWRGVGNWEVTPGKEGGQQASVRVNGAGSQAAGALFFWETVEDTPPSCPTQGARGLRRADRQLLSGCGLLWRRGGGRGDSGAPATGVDAPGEQPGHGTHVCTTPSSDSPKGPSASHPHWWRVSVPPPIDHTQTLNIIVVKYRDVELTTVTAVKCAVQRH